MSKGWYYFSAGTRKITVCSLNIYLITNSVHLDLTDKGGRRQNFVQGFCREHHNSIYSLCIVILCI